MSNIKEHIIFKGAIIILIIALLVPSFVKLAHAFEDHEHEVCVSPHTEHFHEYNLECEFFKFKVNPQIAIVNQSFKALDIQERFTVIISQYQSIGDYQRLPFSLRGPPSLV